MAREMMMIMMDVNGRSPVDDGSLDQARHEVNQLYLAGEMTPREWRQAHAAIKLHDPSRTCYIDMSRGPGPSEAESMASVRDAVARKGMYDIELLAKLAVQAEVPHCISGRPGL